MMPRSSGSMKKRLKFDDDSVTESTRTNPKTRGKMTRNNEKIGNLTIVEANEIAVKATGYHRIDLTIPHRCEADAAGSMKCISSFDEDDVVIQRKLCMICMQNPMDAFYKPHVAQMHPEVSSETSEVMRRLSDVRYSRFCHNGHITRDSIYQMFPSVHPVPLINFLAGIGFIVCRKSSSKPKTIDFEKKFQEPDVRGVRKQLASEIVGKLKRTTIIFKDELEFSAEIVKNSRMLDPSTQTTVHCHICDKIFNMKNFARHMQIHKKNWENKYPEYSINDMTEIFKRIADVRKAMYYASQPVKISAIAKLCGTDVDIQKKLINFLLDAGFVVDDSNELRDSQHLENLAKKVVIADPDSSNMPSLFEEDVDIDGEQEHANQMPKLAEEEEMYSEISEPGSSEQSGFDTRSRSSSVTSETSSASSNSSVYSRIVLRPCSSPSDEPFPYCILNAIPEHLEVEHALFGLLEAMTDDSEFLMDSAQFGFLLGYSMYCLVVANGCKQNVISRMKLGDFRKATFDEQSGLHCFSFSTKTTCKQLDIIEYLCADERIWRALEIFEVARERRAREMGWNNMNEDTAPFFFSYVSPLPIIKDTNYWMSQFLRTCGIHWLCRSSAICSAAWSLVPKDSTKTGHRQYAITYFKFLREKERSQIQLLDNGLSGHQTYQKISSVVISKNKRDKTAPHEKIRKKQKRYRSSELVGMPKKPRGGDRKSEKFLSKTGDDESSNKNTYELEKLEERDSESEFMETGDMQLKDNIIINKDERTQLFGFVDSESSSSHPNSETHLPKPSMQYQIQVEGDLTITCL